MRELDFIAFIYKLKMLYYYDKRQIAVSPDELEIIDVAKLGT